jgi:hypothetical protein
MNGGTAVVPPPLAPAGTSIILNSASVAACTVILPTPSVWSSSRLRSSWRGAPPLKVAGGRLVPVTFS